MPSDIDSRVMMTLIKISLLLYLIFGKKKNEIKRRTTYAAIIQYTGCTVER
jgi:hypothetical protein